MANYEGTEPITNDEDILDSREIVARIEHLEGLLEDEDVPKGERLTEEEAHELLALRELASEAEGYAPDWHYGEVLIRDSYFETYAEQLAEDIGVFPTDRSWPFTHINWEAAAEELRQDYSEVDFGGVTYWVR